MRRLYLVLFTVSLTVSAIAQSYPSSMTFQKNKYSVATIQVPFEAYLVNDGVKDYMSRKGLKSTGYKGFTVYRSVPFDSTGQVLGDAYFNIESKSRSEKDITYINLIPVKKDQPLLPANVDDSAGMNRALSFLNRVKPYLINYAYEQQIHDQEEAVAKTQSKLSRLKNDSGDIASKIRNYQNNLKDNKNDQDQATRDIQNAGSDPAALSKANKKMSKLQDRQNDYEKRLRNAQTDADENRKDLSDQQSLLQKQSQTLDALKQKQQSASASLP
ncbi:MAG TPA: hypothetical protein VG890_16415 [Puia sp.]|nr:hypothetical protein [Puia sp.]